MLLTAAVFVYWQLLANSLEVVFINYSDLSVIIIIICDRITVIVIHPGQNRIPFESRTLMRNYPSSDQLNATEMSTPLATVRVEPLEGKNALKMIWQRQVIEQDVREAFQVINTCLNEADGQMWVMVDLLSNPNFPLGATIQGALCGPYRNPKLREWLIIGSNPLARVIARTLAGVTGKSNVRWFDTEADGLAYLEDCLA
jgi:hypothetical protein